LYTKIWHSTTQSRTFINSSTQLIFLEASHLEKILRKWQATRTCQERFHLALFS
jgi:hypothetical protein